MRNHDAISDVTTTAAPRPRRRKPKRVLRRGETFPDKRAPIGEYFHLKDVENDTSARAYCGPTAVASIVEAPISEVADAFRTVRHGPNWTTYGMPSIRRTTIREMEEVLAMYGYEGRLHWISGKPTLASFLENRQSSWRTYPSIVGVYGHVTAVCGWQFCDTFSFGRVVDAEEAPRRRSRVNRIFVITHRIPPRRPIVRRNER